MAGRQWAHLDDLCAAHTHEARTDRSGRWLRARVAQCGERNLIWRAHSDQKHDVVLLQLIPIPTHIPAQPCMCQSSAVATKTSHLKRPSRGVVGHAAVHCYHAQEASNVRTGGVEDGCPQLRRRALPGPHWACGPPPPRRPSAAAPCAPTPGTPPWPPPPHPARNSKAQLRRMEAAAPLSECSALQTDQTDSPSTLPTRNSE